MTTTERLLSLLSLLQARRDWPGALLASRLEVSERTVRRDVDRLRELGYDVRAIKGPDGGYRLDAGAELPPLLLDDDQAVAIVVALRAAATSGAGIEEGADRALATLRQVLPARLRARVDALDVAVLPRGGPTADPAVLVAVSAAVRDRRVLRFDYGGATSGPPRRAEPRAVVAAGGRWYLVAWDLDRDDWRIFRVDRIAPSSHAGAPFTPREIPGGDAAAYVAGRFRGADGPGGWPCVGEVLLARPAHEVAPYLDDGATVEAVGEDRCRLRLGAWSWPALAARIGQLEADVEVVGPPPLRRAFADLASRFARAGAS